MEAISLLNEDLMKRAFAFWKVYKQKCLDSRTYHEQRSKQKIFVFWKHYSKKREQIRTNLALSKLNKDLKVKDRIITKWRQFARSRAKVNILAQQLAKKINIKMKTKYYNHWSRIYEHLTYTREADQLSNGHYREKLLEKVLRGLQYTVHREMTQKMNKSRAVEHRDSRKLMRFFVKWHGYAAKKRILREKEAELKKERRIQALEGCMREWIFAYESTVKIENFRSKHLKIGLFEALQKVERYNNRIIARVQEFYNRREGTVETRLLRRCFGKLKLAMSLRRRKEEYMEDSTERLAKKFFKRWRREYLRAQEIEGNLLQTMDLQRYKVLSSVFEGWAGHVMKRKGERLLGEELKRRTEKKAIKKWYKQWRSSLEEIREEKYCEEVFMQAHGKDLLRRGFEGLRERMEKANNDRVKVKKIHRKKLLSVAFRALKERVVKRREKRENRISKEEVTNYYNTILLGQCLLTWKIETQKKVQKRKLVEKFRERREMELKGFLFKALEWNRANQKNIRGVQEMYSKRTLANGFARWREEFLVSVAGREMREMKEQRVMRACFDEIRNAGRENKKMKMLKILEEKYGDRRVLEDAFEDWRDMIRYQGGDLKEFKEVNLLRKVMRGLKGQKARRLYKEEMGILIEQRSLMRVFRGLKRVADQQRRLREQEEQMIIYDRWKRLQRGFMGLKKGYNEVKELMGQARDMIHRRSDRLLVKGFTFWKYYTIRKRENEAIIAEFQARRLERTVGSRLLRYGNEILQ